MRVGWRLSTLCMAALLLLLPSCGGKSATPPPDEGAAPASSEAAQETAPASADTGERRCFYLFWAADPGDVAELKRAMAEGGSFAGAANRLRRDAKKGRVRLNADCLPVAQLDSQVLTASGGLAEGQVSEPFDYQEGRALLMVTTDRHWDKAMAAFQEQHWEEAIEALRLHLELHPDSTAAVQMMGQAQRSLGQPAQALLIYNGYLKDTPRSLLILNERGNTHMEMRNYSLAVADYRAAREISPDDPLLKNNLAWALLKEGLEMERAEELARQAVAASPRMAEFWDTLGKIQQARGENAEAVISLHRALVEGKGRAPAGKALVDSLANLDAEEVARLRAGKGSPAPTLKGATQAVKEAAPEVKETAPAARETAPAAKEIAPAVRETAPAATQEPPEPETDRAARKADGAVQSPSPADGPFPALKKGYYIQVATYRHPSSAERAVRQWRRKGYEAHRESWSVQKGEYWIRVLLGPYPNRSTALGEGRLLAKNKLLKTYVLVPKD